MTPFFQKGTNQQILYFCLIKIIRVIRNYSCQKPLHSKTLPTSAASAGIGVIEVKAFSIKAIAEIQFGIYQV